MAELIGIKSVSRDNCKNALTVKIPQSKYIVVIEDKHSNLAHYNSEEF